MDEGRLAALGAATDLGALSPDEAVRRARPLRARLRRKERFRAALRRLHHVGPGIQELATPQTIVCRCEELTAAQLDSAIAATADLNVVKMLTRVTMGLCQGRNCERHVVAALARHHRRDVMDLPLATPRAPARPAPIGAVADASVEDEGFFAVGV
jgi:hydrogen cyanide synthase HcnB